MKMFKFQNILAILLLIGSATLAIFIVTEEKSADIEAGSANLTVNQEFFPSLIDDTANPTNSREINKLSQKITEEIIKLNPEGPIVIDGKQQLNALEPNTLVQKVLEAELGNINYPDLSPVIDGSTLKIIKSSDKVVWENYFKNFRAILMGNFSSVNVDFQKPTSEDFKKLVLAYEKTLEQFYSLNVPEVLAVVHKEEIKLLTIQKNIFASLANYEQDPLKALIAGKMIGGIRSQFVALNQKVSEFIVKNNLKV